jgi:hypothetical protein
MNTRRRDDMQHEEDGNGLILAQEIFMGRVFGRDAFRAVNTDAGVTLKGFP